MSTDTNEIEVEGEVLDAFDEQGGNVQALDAITRAEIDIAITTAKRFPRNLTKFKDRVASMATLDEETAADCFYSLRREGKTIQGPSVRLAEIALGSYGNIRAGARLLGESENGKFVRALGVCHDLEHNVYIAIEATRRITDKKGRRYSDDMIAVTSNAAASVAFRNAVLRVVPRALLKAAYLKAKQVATGDAKTLRERREAVFQRLSGLNPLITAERVLAAVGRQSIDEVTIDDLTHLIGLGTAVKEGETTIDDAFPPPERTGSVETSEIIGRSAGGTAAAAAAASGSSAQGSANETEGAAAAESSSPAMSPEKLAALERQAEAAGLSPEEWADLLAKYPDPIPADYETSILSAISRISKDKRKKG